MSKTNNQGQDKNKSMNGYWAQSRLQTTGSNQAVTAALKLMRESLADTDAPQAANVEVKEFNGANHSLDISGIIVHKVMNAIVVYHFIPVASTCITPTRYITLSGKTNAKVNVPTAVSDLMDDSVYTQIERDLAVYYKNRAKVTGVQDSGFSILQSEDNNDIIRALVGGIDAMNDVAAFKGVVDAPFAPLLSQLAGMRPTARIEFNNDEILSGEQLPVRTDISVAVSVAVNGNTIDETERRKQLFRIGGFCNLNYQEAEHIAVPGQGMIPSTVQYQPEFIITNSMMNAGVASLEALIIQIYAATAISNKNAWIATWKPSTFVGAAGSKEVNARDIGAIGYDLRPTGNKDVDGKPIATNTTEFADRGIYELASAYLKPSIGFSIDVPDSGPESYIQKILSFTASDGTPAGNERAVRAMEAVRNAVNRATNNAFSKYDKGEPAILAGSNRVFLGTYQRPDGSTGDIREIDFLYMLNHFGATDMELVSQFADTFDRLEIEEAERLALREDILQKIAPHYKRTGTATRDRLNPVWLMNVIQAFGETGGTAIVIEGTQDQVGQGQRGNAVLANFGINNDIVNGAFNQGGNSVNAQGGSFTRAFTRY